MNYQVRRRRAAAGRNLAVFTLAAMAGAGLARANQTATQPSLHDRTQQQVGTAFNRIGSGVRELHLTSTQRSKIRGIFQQSLPQAKTIWTNPDLTSAQKRGRLMALARPAKGVLNPEQQKRAEELRRVAVNTALENWQWASDELDLSAKQQKQLKVIAFDALEKSLTVPASKEGGPNYAALHNLAAGTETKVQAVLNKDQIAKWRVMRGVVWHEVSQRAGQFRAFVG